MRRSAARAMSAGGPSAHHCLLLAVDMLDLGILFLDRDYRIIFANRSAEARLRLRRRAHAGNDLIDQRQIATPLDQQIRAVVRRGRSRTESHIVTTSFGGRLLFLLVMPCGAGSDAIDILFVGEPSQYPPRDLSLVAPCYGLTGAETRLLQALVKGDTLSIYAGRAGLTLNTVKGYLKQLFRKTSTARQSDLLRLIVANPILHLALATRPR